jgi:hypothetical protein
MSCLLFDLPVDLLAVNGHFARPDEAEPNRTAADAQHRNGDVLADLHPLAFLSAQH